MQDPILAVNAPQEHFARQIRETLIAADPGRLHPQAVLFTADDAPEFARLHLGQALGREIIGKAVWLRFYRAAFPAGLLIGLHNFVAPGEMELVVAGNQGQVTRSALRFGCEWAFRRVGLLRVVTRIPVEARQLQDFARRSGFRFEGVSRGFGETGGDVSVWAMLNCECPWLPRPVSAIPAVDTSPPASTKVH